jgi:hypothetical protein
MHRVHSHGQRTPEPGAHQASRMKTAAIHSSIHSYKCIVRMHTARMRRAHETRMHAADVKCMGATEACIVYVRIGNAHLNHAKFIASYPVQYIPYLPGFPAVTTCAYWFKSLGKRDATAKQRRGRSSMHEAHLCIPFTLRYRCFALSSAVRHSMWSDRMGAIINSSAVINSYAVPQPFPARTVIFFIIYFHIGIYPLH